MACSYPSWQISICLIFWSLLSSMFIHFTDSYPDPKSLDALIRTYANKRGSKDRTGSVHKVSLPVNFSGMEASVVRLRTSTFWERGANFSPFAIPPRIITRPFAKRIAIVFENLGNWSSSYYQVPGHSLVSPVIGFHVYDASNSTSLGAKNLNFSFMIHPVLISFPHRDQNLASAPKCVRFGDGSSVKFSNMTRLNQCSTHSQGHFAVVVVDQSLQPAKNRAEKLLKWWVLGFVIGFVVLGLLISIGVVVFKIVRMRKIRDMERESEKSVAVETIWINTNKMPAASMTRTQPALEHSYVP
ncbi:uncharacterized protein LOC110807102 [Carica papaya]|uniref:uncharacterized protein LOC110807102 n=1 Tax=Carica papaya TaxID=3649 RepID=UPI000B8D1B01|nr:uncharacterized protein LOC110807102 [Carica papaya]